MKRLFFLFIAAAITISACKKSDNNSSTTSPPAETDHTPASSGNPAFSITGIHDIDLGNTSTASVRLPIQITQSSGRNSETVAISVFDLPAGVYADAAPLDGTTPYSSAITFHTDYSGPGGEYTVHIQGGGSSGTMRYPLRIYVPEYNGFETDSFVYEKASVIKDTSTSATGNHYIAALNNNGGVRLILSFANGVKIPAKASSYRIVSAPVGQDEMQLQLYDYGLIYTSTSEGSPTGSFTFDSLGKFIFRCKNVELYDGFHKRHITASFSE